MSKSRFFLGSVVSASILAVSAAGPALANPGHAASAGPVSTVSSVLQADGLASASPLRGVSGILGLPAADRVANRAVSRADGVTGIGNKTSRRPLNAAVNRLTSSIRRSSPVSGDLRSAIVPGLGLGSLGSISGTVPALSSVNSDLPGFRH